MYISVCGSKDQQFVFAVAMRNGSATTGSIRLPAAAAHITSVLVLGEERRISVAGGVWTDSFSGFQVHNQLGE